MDKIEDIALSRVLFWDTDYDSIDWVKHARYVIGRVVMYGTLADWRTIQKKYGKDKIIEEMLQYRDLDPKSLSFLSCIFDIPKEKFACFTQIQSARKHFPY
jgi:hypothetical protein